MSPIFSSSLNISVIIYQTLVHSVTCLSSSFQDCPDFQRWKNIIYPYHIACGILVLWPRVEPGPCFLAAKHSGPNHWITKELPE